MSLGHLIVTYKYYSGQSGPEPIHNFIGTESTVLSSSLVCTEQIQEAAEFSSSFKFLTNTGLCSFYRVIRTHNSISGCNFTQSSKCKLVIIVT